MPPPSPSPSPSPKTSRVHRNHRTKDRTPSPRRNSNETHRAWTLRILINWPVCLVLVCISLGSGYLRIINTTSMPSDATTTTTIPPPQGASGSLRGLSYGNQETKTTATVNPSDCSTPPVTSSTPKNRDIVIPRVHLPTDQQLQLAPSRFDRAYQESLGFFDDIAQDQWELRKKITHRRRHNRYNDGGAPAQDQHAPTWYQENWDPDFACFFEDYLGNEGDGHKWVCDPHRLKKSSERRVQQGQAGCLVYSIGSEGKFDFEQDLQDLLPMCEIHVFDMGNYKYHVPFGLNVSFHQWGIRPSTMQVPFARSFAFHSPYIPGKGERVWEEEGNDDLFKSFQETVKLLGHEGRVLDILKIDCEGCEWFTYKDWLSGVVDVRQILVEMHDTPPTANDFFADLHAAHYVMFHKEPNIQYSGGSCIEVSFLKLADSFFANATMYESKSAVSPRRRDDALLYGGGWVEDYVDDDDDDGAGDV